MKKMVLFIAMGVLCLCVTSCGNIVQDAYIAEINYRDAIKRNDVMELKYKQEFLDIYCSMNEQERIEYRKYRIDIEKEIERIEFAEHEALELRYK